MACAFKKITSCRPWHRGLWQSWILRRMTWSFATVAWCMGHFSIIVILSHFLLIPYMPGPCHRCHTSHYMPLHAITCHTRAAPTPFFIHSSWLFHGFSLGFIMNLGQGQVCTVCEVCLYFLDFLGQSGSGCRADATYFTLHGALSYLKNDDPTRVRFGQWISEMCLWTEWFHVGDLLSVSRLLAFVQCARH